MGESGPRPPEHHMDCSQVYSGMLQASFIQFSSFYPFVHNSPPHLCRQLNLDPTWYFQHILPQKLLNLLLRGAFRDQMVWTRMWEHLSSWLLSNRICITTVIRLDQNEEYSVALDPCASLHSANYLFLPPPPFFQSSSFVLSHFTSSPIYCHSLYFPAIVIFLFFHPSTHPISLLFNLSLTALSLPAPTALTPGGCGWQWDVGGVGPSQLADGVPAGCVCCLCKRG